VTLEIHLLRTVYVTLDGSQTVEPSNRLNRIGRRFSRRFAFDGFFAYFLPTPESRGLARR
jgi:hypothetical protein